MLAVVLGLILGCSHIRATYISKVQRDFQDFGMNIISDSVQKEDLTIYYFYAYYGESFRYSGWYCWEYTCDKTGLVLKMKEYWIGNDKAFDEFKKRIR